MLKTAILTNSLRATSPPLGLQRPLLGGRVNFPMCLAPMVGLTHVAFRLLARSYMPEGARTLWPTEMLNSRRLPQEDLEKTPETLRDESESELTPQILANERDPIQLSIARLEEWGASAIDVNMGCPVKKALSHNYGVALMGDAKYAADVVRIATSNSRLPISVKLRAGHQNDRPYLSGFVRGLEDAGASWLTLHPRTAAQKRRGAADWSQISEVRAVLRIPVIGNGDVQTADDAIAMLTSTGCDLAMVGRAMTARPWLLWQFGERLGWPAPRGRLGQAPSTPKEEGAEYGRSLRALSQLMRQHFVDKLNAEELALRKFRFYVRTGSPWLAFGHDLYARVSGAKSFNEIDARLDLFFAQEHSMSAHTALRQ